MRHTAINGISAAALPPTARHHSNHGLPRLRRRADSALVQAAQVAPAKRTLERRRRLERWQPPSLRMMTHTISRTGSACTCAAAPHSGGVHPAQAGQACPVCHATCECSRRLATINNLNTFQLLATVAVDELTLEVRASVGVDGAEHEGGGGRSGRRLRHRGLGWGFCAATPGTFTVRPDARYAP